MEAEPQLNAARPSPLRLAGFLTAVVAALLAGVGAAQTWVTVGFEKLSGLDSPTKGIDVWQGRAILACAVIFLVGVLASRLVAGRARVILAGLVIAAGAVCAAAAGAFLVLAPSAYSPIDNRKLIDALAKLTHATPDVVMAQACTKLGCTTTIGIGPWLAVLGGALGFVAGILALAWATRVTPTTTEPATEPATEA